MADDQTVADAQGNASALVNVIESSPPETCPFAKGPLTRDMEALHMINNVDILEIAEEMAVVEGRLADARKAVERPMGPAQMMQSRESRMAMVTWYEEDLEKLEDEILAELDEVQTEYRDLALSLCEGRQEYVEARRRAGMDDLPSSADLHMMRSPRTGVGPSHRPELTYDDLETIDEFERYHEAYKALEHGFHHMTTWEQFKHYAGLLAREAAIEAATLGAGKYIRAVRYLDELAGAVASRGARAVVSRYQKLPSSIRQRMDRIFSRRHTDQPHNPANDGPTGTGRTSSTATRPCRVGACR